MKNNELKFAVEGSFGISDRTLELADEVSKLNECTVSDVVSHELRCVLIDSFYDEQIYDNLYVILLNARYDEQGNFICFAED